MRVNINETEKINIRGEKSTKPEVSSLKRSIELINFRKANQEKRETIHTKTQKARKGDMIANCAEKRAPGEDSEQLHAN